jgi:hypothetical protein
MSRADAIKSWVKENAPILTQVFDNKYVGMLYDRFASLSVKRQKQVILASIASVVLLIAFYLVSSYWSMWVRASRISDYQTMGQLLRDYQKQQREQSVEMQSLDKNSRLSAVGQFKEYLIASGRSAGISPRMIQIEERADSSEGETGEVKLRRASVRVEKVNLRQLKMYLQIIETGDYNLSVASMKVSNDDKIRGYMNADLTVVAYLFQAGEDVP